MKILFYSHCYLLILHKKRALGMFPFSNPGGVRVDAESGANTWGMQEES